MNNFPRVRTQQCSPRNPSDRFTIPPPPLPPWVGQRNFLPPPTNAPPPGVPHRYSAPLSFHNNSNLFPSHAPTGQPPPAVLSELSFPSPHFQTNADPFTLHTFQGPPFPATNIPDMECDRAPSSKLSVTQVEVDNWMKRKGKSPRVAKAQPKTEIQIHAVREKLNTVFGLVRELENGARTLAVMVKTVTDDEWQLKCTEIEIKKKELTELLEELHLSEENLKTFKEKHLKRSKKRQRLKWQKEKWKRAKKEERVLTQNKHVQLDNWLLQMQEGVERLQREEELKREADAVLWGITQKKTESRRQASLLSALLELRQVKVKRLIAAGKPVSETQIQVFNTVIEGLQKMWTKHLEEIGLEEHVLRGMLTQERVEDDAVKNHRKLVLHEWETAIFGSLGKIDSNLKGKELEEIRWSWDQFIVPEHTVLSSTIPNSCVLPVPPSSGEWCKLLKY